MASEIFIKPGFIVDHGWSFVVTFSGRQHAVVCTQAFWKKMSHGDISPMDVVRLGIELALKQRVADSLPPEFNIENLESRIHDFTKRLRLASHIEASANPS